MWRPWMCGPSASPCWRWAAGGGGWKTRSIPGSDFTDIAAIGEEVGPGRPLCLIHAASDVDADAAASALRAAITIGDKPATLPPAVRQRIGRAAS